MCSSQPSRIKPQRPLKKLPTKFKIKPRRSLRKSQESRKSSNPVQDQSCGKSTSAKTNTCQFIHYQSQRSSTT
ncbi:hypothetical protein ACFX13_013200 [Malus domestica]